MRVAVERARSTGTGGHILRRRPSGRRRTAASICPAPDREPAYSPPVADLDEPAMCATVPGLRRDGHLRPVRALATSPADPLASQRAEQAAGTRGQRLAGNGTGPGNQRAGTACAVGRAMLPCASPPDNARPVACSVQPATPGAPCAPTTRRRATGPARSPADASWPGSARTLHGTAL